MIEIVSVAGRKIFANADGVVCRILTHAEGATSFTLDAAYTGDGGAGLTFSVFQDEYDLADDFLLPVNPARFLRDCQGSYAMSLVSPNELEATYPNPSLCGPVARMCALIADRRIRLAPWPVEGRRYEYSYVFRPIPLTFDGSVSDVPIIQPPEDRIVLAYVAASELMLDKEDDRFQALSGAGPTKLAVMKAQARKILRGRMFLRSANSIGTPR